LIANVAEGLFLIEQAFLHLALMFEFNLDAIKPI
jgi:hypothetical protein